MPAPGRALDDRTTQVTTSSYTAHGQVLTRTDPLGRQTTYTYALNGTDLLEVRQTSPGVNDLLASFANYNERHQPGSVTDAAGQTTTYTYNASGQILTVTTPARSGISENRTTTQFAFDPWGRRTLVQGSDITRAGFTGHRWEAGVSTWLTAYRQLDPEIGRWLTEDPIGLSDGINRYAYVQNNPINRLVPVGLKSYMCKKPLHAMGGKGKRSGPDVWGNPLYHQYYCVERNG
jgi:RHS repeat-associated protein